MWALSQSLAVGDRVVSNIQSSFFPSLKFASARFQLSSWNSFLRVWMTMLKTADSGSWISACVVK